MKYWLCIEGSPNQGIEVGCLTKTPDDVDITNGLDSYDDSVWKEISEKEYKNYLNNIK